MRHNSWNILWIMNYFYSMCNVIQACILPGIAWKHLDIIIFWLKLNFLKLFHIFFVDCMFICRERNEKLFPNRMKMTIQKSIISTYSGAKYVQRGNKKWCLHSINQMNSNEYVYMLISWIIIMIHHHHQLALRHNYINTTIIIIGFINILYRCDDYYYHL